MKIQQDIVKPISVSPIKPIYDKWGEIIEWRVIVKTEDTRFLPLLWIDKAFEIVPRAKGNYSVSFSRDTEKNFTEIKYFFKKGLWNRGYRKACEFRNEILSQIVKQNNEKVN